MPSELIIIVIEFMFLGINIFWALLSAHFNPHLTARAKMSLSQAQNIFMPASINSIVLLKFCKHEEHNYYLNNTLFTCLSLPNLLFINIKHHLEFYSFHMVNNQSNNRTIALVNVR